MTNAIAGEPVKVNITAKDFWYPTEYEAIYKNQLIKISRRKRYYMQVMKVNKNSPYEHALTCKMVYKPSPKSKLHNKTVFSKIKIKLIK